MNGLMIYIIKVSVLTAAFAVLYHLLLSRDTSYNKNRAVLLLSLVISYIMPLCVVTLHRPATVQMVAEPPVTGYRVESSTFYPESPVELDLTDSAETETKSRPELLISDNNHLWSVILLIIYSVGIAIFYSVRLYSVFKVSKIIRNGRRVMKAPGYVIIMSHETKPFSWINYIVLPESGNEAKTEKEKTWEEAVISHEVSHIKHRHWIDIMLIDIMSAFQWFNPAIWLLRRELSDIHEFQADSDVIDSGFPVADYQMHLLSTAVSKNREPVTIGFGESSLKSRMLMMSRPRSGAGYMLKYLYVPALTVVFLGFTSNVVYDKTDAPYILASGISLSEGIDASSDTLWFEGYSFSIVNEAAVLTGFDWNMAETLGDIPSTVEYGGKKYEVRAIGPSALSGIGIRNLIIPEGITEIAFEAFGWNGNLENVTIPSTVCMIQPKTFNKCVNLKNVYISDGLKNLPEGMFLDCRNLESVRLPSTLETIGYGAFSDCRNLQKINLPRKLKIIGNEAFFRCAKLTSVRIPKKLEYLGDGAFFGCRSMESVNTVKLKARIGEKVFYADNE